MKLPTQPNPWKTVSSREVYRNPWIRVREDQVITPSGASGIYGVVESKIATGVVALTAENEVYLIGQYRYPTAHYSWEIIEGGAEAGETPQRAAARELAEEAGLRAASWEQLGAEFHLSNCFSAERGVLFLARELTVVPVTPDDTELLEVRRVPLAQALEMLDSGEITDAMTIVALHRIARRGAIRP